MLIMPHSHFFLFVVAASTLSLSAHGTEWRDCEKAKLHELNLQRGNDDRKTSKRKSHSHGESRRQSAEEIDTWLWKNCREFSYELRQLEQEKM
jgi:hypothetical protein